MNSVLFFTILLIVIIIPVIVLADGWDSSKPSHATLYSDTITSKTDASSVNIADSLFATGDITTLGKIGIGTTSPNAKLEVSGDIIAKAGTPLILQDASGTEAMRIISDPPNVRLRPGASGDFDFESSAGADLMWIDNGGNVGIGTTSPIVKLQVVGPMRFGTSGTRGLLDDSSTPGAGSIQLTADDLTTSGILFRTRNAVGTGDRMVINNNGNVGIGETNPGADLDIKSKTAGANTLSDARSTAAMWVDGIAGGSSWGLAVGQVAGLFDSYLQAMDKAQQSAAALLLNPYGGTVGIGTTSPSTKLNIKQASNDEAQGIRLTDAGGSNYGSMYYNGGLILQATGNGFLSLEDSGNVGIGTSSPGRKLTVVGDLSLDGNTNSLFFDNSAGSIDYQIYEDSSNRLRIGNGADANIFTLDSSGKVGIGTTSPSTKLEVAGAITATSGISSFTNTGNGDGIDITQTSTGTYTSSLLNLFTAKGGTDNSFNFIRGRDTANSVTRFLIYNSGDIVNVNNAYGAISDIKLKQDITDTKSQWDNIKNIQVREYRLKSDVIEKDNAPTHTGVIAQEVENIYPELVTQIQDTDKDNNPMETSTKTFAYSQLYMKSIKALQEAIGRIEILENTTQQQRTEINELKQIIWELDSR